MAEVIQASFTSGELAPGLRSRVDLAKYATGLALCENFIIKAQGGAYSRPGTRFVDEVGDSTKVARLIPFKFNSTQNYVLVFEDLKMRVVRDGAYILSGGTPYEITTPYTEAELSYLVFAQDADVMTITHPSHDPYDLGRVTETNWTLTLTGFTPSVVPPATGPVLTIVGTGAGSYNKNYTYVVTAVDADGVESVASASSTLNTPSLSTTAGIHLSWPAVIGADHYRIYKDPSNGTGVYGWIGNSTVTTFEDYNVAPVTSDAPPQARTPFAGADNKPSCVGYYQQRKIYGGTNNQPQTIFTTETGIYNSLRTSFPTKDTDAITFTVKTKQVNPIRHIVDMESLILFTAGDERRVTESQDNVLTPASAGSKTQSTNGISATVAPVVVNSTILYVQEKGARVRNLDYDLTAGISGKYTGSDLSIMAKHLTDGYTIVAMDYSLEPDGILWLVRSDGVLLGLTYLKQQKVWGWHHHVTKGKVESLTVISEAGRDAVYMVVNRTINGATVRYIERLEPRIVTSAADAFCVDAGLTYNGAPATTISGLDHLEGESVAVLADGNEVTGLTVTAGAITLPIAASIVHIGLAYTPVLETLDLDSGSRFNAVRGKEVSVSHVTLEVEDSRGGWVGPRPDADGDVEIMHEIKPRFDSDWYDAIALRTFKENIDIEPKWSSGGGIRIEQRSPLPMGIISITPRFDVG